MRRPALLATLGLAAALAAVARVPSPETSRPNVVLITLDTTRADHLGAYGWTHAQTPNLDALARRGARFERCDTAAPITLPSHATILTGLFPPRHGVRDNGTFALPAAVETITSRLRAAGYDTGAVVSAIVLARRYGLDQGFRIYDDDLGTGYAAGTEMSERPAEATTRAALAVVSKLRAPFFLWVHYFDPHEEYRPPARFAEKPGGPHRLYDGEIAYMDEQIGALLARVPAPADIAVVGDHGEMLGERGELTHGLLLYAGARRVPLILAGPDVPAGRTVPCLVRTADVAPTVLSWARVAVPAGLDGAPLVPLPAAPDCRRSSYVESFLPFFAYRWYPPRAMSDGRSLYLHSPSSSLYMLAADPAEERDVAPQQRAVAEAWERRLEELLAGMGEGLDREITTDKPVSDEQARKLRSLGYLGGSGGGLVDPGLPDARTMTGVARQIHDATQQMQNDQFAEALSRLKAVLRQDPRNFTALTLAARCLQEADQCEEAIPLLRRASEQNPRSEVPLVNTGGCLVKLGRMDEAMAEFHKALVLDPTQAESAANLARLLRERGDPTQALRVLDGAIAAGSHEPEVILERGLTLAEMNRLADALESFREAARRNPGDPVALENAARAAYRLQRYGESAQLYERLTVLTPTSAVWRTLGAIYLSDLGDRASSLRCFREALRVELDPAVREQIKKIVGELERGGGGGIRTPGTR